MARGFLDVSGELKVLGLTNEDSRRLGKEILYPERRVKARESGMGLKTRYR